MPAQMLRYRAAAFWQRVYCPEISMGLYTEDEINDIQEVEYVEVPTSSEKRETIDFSTGEVIDNVAEALKQSKK
jgi:hypothetical protein